MDFRCKTGISAINEAARSTCIHPGPSPEFELDPPECFELLLPLYGICDAGDLWHELLTRHSVKDLNLQPTKADPSLYFSFRDSNLVGIHWYYVNDLLHAGDAKFRKRFQLTHERFETSGDEEIPINFAGLHITIIDGQISMDQ